MCQGTTHADTPISLRNPYGLQVPKWVSVKGKDSECHSFPQERAGFDCGTRYINEALLAAGE